MRFKDRKISIKKIKRRLEKIVICSSFKNLKFYWISSFFTSKKFKLNDIENRDSLIYIKENEKIEVK